jgi:glucose-1-phosphate thymidylyltransferase
MHDDKENMVHESVQMEGSVIIQPSYIGKNVKLNRSVVGPYASIGDGCIIQNSVVSNCIVQTNTKLVNAVIDNAMIGNSVEYNGEAKDLSIGDFTTVL